MTNSLVPLDPDPHEWLCERRIHYLQNSLSPSAQLLEDISFLDQVLFAWLLREVLADTNESTLSDSFFENTSFDSFSLSIIKSQFCDDDDLNRLLSWAKSRWEHRLEVLYLNNQSKLDLLRCRLITLENEYLAFEIYCRLKSEEESFENLSMKYGVGAERFNGGLYPLQPLQSFPKPMQSIIRKINPGDFIKPFKLGGRFAVFQLAEWHPSSFGIHSKKQLLLWELEDWLLAMLPSLKRHLELYSTSIS